MSNVFFKMNTLIFSLCLLATATLHAQLPKKQQNTSVQNLKAKYIENWHASYIQTDAYKKQDPTAENAENWSLKVFKFGKRAVLRATARINGILVEGADRLFELEHSTAGSYTLKQFYYKTALKVQNSFTFTPEEIVDFVAQQNPNHLILDTTVQNTDSFVKAVYYSHQNKLWAAYVVRLPVLDLRALQDVWVRADSKEILKVTAAALFIDSPKQAQVFKWWPSLEGDLNDDLTDVELENLLEISVRKGLLGEYFDARNCCSFYKCFDEGTSCKINNPKEAYCVDGQEQGAIPSTITLPIPSELISSSIPAQTIYIRSKWCAELPKIEASENNSGDLGWYAAPMDSEIGGEFAAELVEADDFSELQVYYATNQFFKHLRSVMDNQSFCLSDASMQCNADGTPKLDQDGQAVHSFHLSVNMAMPKFDQQALVFQYFTGQGRTAENPLTVKNSERVDNAMFLPALQGGAVTIPAEYVGLNEVLARDYDSNVYYQGIQRDFAYDSSIIFHEFTHAIIHTLKPNLGSVIKDEQGIIAAPGGMNEGYADFFSSSFTGFSEIGSYAGAGLTPGHEISLRNAENTKKCPDNISGEVHDDSEAFVGALWQIRQQIIAANNEESVPLLENILYARIALMPNSPNFDEEAQKISEDLSAEFGNEIKEKSLKIFTERGIIGCKRIQNLSVLAGADMNHVTFTAKQRLSIPSPNSIGLNNFTPAAVQLKVEVPAYVKSFTLKWKQPQAQAAFGGGAATASLAKAIIIEDTKAMHFTYTGSPTAATQALTSTDDIIELSKANYVESTISGDVASLTYTREGDSCDKSTYVLMLTNDTASNIRITDLNVLLPEQDAEIRSVCLGETPEQDAGSSEPDSGKEPDTIDDGCDCSSSKGTAQNALFLLFASILMFFKRRSRDA